MSNGATGYFDGYKWSDTILHSLIKLWGLEEEIKSDYFKLVDGEWTVGM